MRRIVLFIISLATLASLSACIHPRIGFRKGKLLDPMMDPAKTGGLHTTMRGEGSMWYEKGSGEGSGSLGGSCPTCGS